MVTLQRRFAYRYKSRNGAKDHYKYIITIPEEIVNELKWEEGDTLQPRVQDNTFVLELVVDTSRMEKTRSKK